MEAPDVDALRSGLEHGRPEAYAALYDRAGPALYRAARTLVRSGVEAEDVVQEVFLSLVRSRHRLGGVADLRAYLFASLRHAAGKRLAKKAAERKGLEQLALRGPRMAPGPSARDDDLERALAALPYEQREVIAMKIDGGLTFAQMAAVLEISMNTAASRYRYAMEKLRERLSGDRR